MRIPGHSACSIDVACMLHVSGVAHVHTPDTCTQSPSVIRASMHTEMHVVAKRNQIWSDVRPTISPTPVAFAFTSPSLHHKQHFSQRCLQS